MAKDQKTKGPKFGAGTVGAMLRQGLQELRGLMYTGSNVAQPTEAGMWGTKTPGEVADDRRGRDRNEEPRPSPLADSLRQAESRSAESPSAEPSAPPMELE